MPDDSQLSNSVESTLPSTLPSPWRCLGGAVVSGAIAVLLYFLLQSIATSFAAKGIHSDNLTAQRISTAVRTLVLGLTALATGIFGFAALGLVGLAIQTGIQGNRSSAS